MMKEFLNSTGLMPFVRRIRAFINIQLLIYSNSYLKKKVIENIELLNKEKIDIDKTVCFALWESDQKFLWLKRKNNTDNIEFVMFPRTVIAKGFGHYLEAYSKTLSDNTIEEFYKENYLKSRESYARYCSRVIQVLEETFKLEGFVVAKLHDDWMIDFIEELNKKSIAVIVNERESVNTAKRLEIAPRYFKDYVVARPNVFCVCNPTHKQFWEKAGFKEKDITLLGDIKSDYWFHPEYWQTMDELHPKLRKDKKIITYFSFGPRTYINYYYPGEERNWNVMIKDCHDVLLDTLRNYGDEVQVIYKTGGKPKRDLFPGFGHYLDEFSKFGEDTFLYMDMKYSAVDLIRYSDLTMGFQTTGLIEAMFTERHIFSVGWGELYDDIKDTMIDFHKTKALSFMSSPEMLKEEVIKIAKGEKLGPTNEELLARKQFREEYYFSPDGKRSETYVRLIDDFFKKSKSDQSRTLSI
jgi:hypothetical protein